MERNRSGGLEFKGFDDEEGAATVADVAGTREG